MSEEEFNRKQQDKKQKEFFALLNATGKLEYKNGVAKIPDNMLEIAEKYAQPIKKPSAIQRFKWRLKRDK